MNKYHTTGIIDHLSLHFSINFEDLLAKGGNVRSIKHYLTKKYNIAIK